MREKQTTNKQKAEQESGMQGRMDRIEPAGPHQGNPATAGPGGVTRATKDSAPQSASKPVNPSSPTEGTEQGSAPHAHGDASGMGPMGYGGSQKPQNQSGSMQDAAQLHSQAQRNKKTFRCADAGYQLCPWEVEGTENEILPQIEQHAKDAHHIQFKPESREHVRHLMKDAKDKMEDAA